MRAADAIVKLLTEEFGVKVVFTVTGGGAMYLNDAFGLSDKLKYIALHHEQSVSMAAEGFAKASSGLAVAQVTTGPGGTNSITGCVGAWIDSEPILFISGQVESFSLARQGSRQSGVQEVNITEFVKPYTKYAAIVNDADSLLVEISKAVKIACSGRQGPVWIDIPLDVQNKEIQYLVPVNASPIEENERLIRRRKIKVRLIARKIINSKFPILCIGNGARKAIPIIKELCSLLDIPLILGWNAKDTLPTDDEHVIGCAGQFGERCANMLLKDADIVIGVGYRFSVPQIGYDPSCYAPNAEIIAVDIDPEEAKKFGFFIDGFVESDSLEFSELLLSEIKSQTINSSFKKTRWLKWANYLKKYDFDPKTRDFNNVNSYDFTFALSKFLPPKAYVVTDMGTSFTCTHQALSLSKNQRLITSSGLAAMGFGLPGAIGVSLFNPKNMTVLITGDGGLMFNLQELQSVVTLKSNLKIIVYENQGYLTMKHMQKARFNRLVAADPNTSVECPDFIKISNAFGIESKEINLHSEIVDGISWLLENKQGPKLLVTHLNPWQELTPRVQTRSDESGKLYPSALDQMYPYLDSNTEININKIKEEILNYD